MSTPTDKPEPCRCIHFDADLDENEDGDVCSCGHSVEEHAPEKGYPGDSSCKAEEF